MNLINKKKKYNTIRLLYPIQHTCKQMISCDIPLEEYSEPWAQKPIQHCKPHIFCPEVFIITSIYYVVKKELIIFN